MSDLQVRVAELNVYPVKSLRGIPLNSACLTPLGIEHDRAWLVLDASGRFITQRDESQLALVSTRLTETGVSLSHPGHGTCLLPFDSAAGTRFHTRVWGDPCETLDCGPEVSDWLSQALGGRNRYHVVRMAPGFQRLQKRPDRYGAATTTLFADGAPYLIANAATLEDLNRELLAEGNSPVPMNRFRPNIVLEGLPAWAEHGLHSLSGPGYTLQPRYPCERCVVPTIDQDTGQRDPQRRPYGTLRRLNPMPGNPAAAAFAENAILAEGAGASIRIGDLLTAIFRDVVSG